MTRFIFSYRRKASKYVVVVLGLFVGFGFIGTANAVQTGPVQVTCTNGTFGTGWDNANQYFEGKGNIAALYCQLIHNTGYVSDNLSDPSLRYYQGVLPIVDSPTATVETHTAQVPPSEETSTVPSSPQETETPVVSPETDTAPVVVDTSTSISDSPTASPESMTAPVAPVETQTSTSESSTQTILPETTTPIEIPLPTPAPVVEPQPIVFPEPVVVEPQPEPLPEPEPEPLPEETSEEAPSEEQPLEEQPVVEEQPPVEEPSELPVEEETNESPVEEPVIQEQPEPTPEPLPQPVAEPAPNSQPDVAYEPPTVTLDNGVILTQEEAVAVVLLQNPAELISELFSDPGAVFSALGSVGADMSPEVREKSEKIVLSAVIAGNIATQAAATAGAVAAYRRKP